MYLTPVFYSLGSFYNDSEPNKNRAATVLGLFIRRFNPMYMYIQQFRYFILQNADPWEVPAWELMWRGGLVALGFLLAGSLLFNKTKNKFILYI